MHRIRVGVLVSGLLSVSAIAAAAWLPVHQIASNRPIYVFDGNTGAHYSPSVGYASSNWQVSTGQAFSHAVAQTTGGQYEFRLVHTSSSDDTTIVGLWDIYHDGVLVCDDCIGKAFGLDVPVGEYFKIYVGTPLTYADLWHFRGYITQRFDY